MPTGSQRKPPSLRLVARTAARPDPQVERALALLCAQLDKRWTVTALARIVGLSRPVFARRFVAHTGLSPARYLARARMQRAAELLCESDAKLALIGTLVGYDSEFAFNRAFKRHHQLAPGNYRKRLWSSALPVLRAAA